MKNPRTASLRVKVLDSQTTKGTGIGAGVDQVIGAGAIAVKDLQVSYTHAFFFQLAACPSSLVLILPSFFPPVLLLIFLFSLLHPLSFSSPSCPPPSSLVLLLSFLSSFSFLSYPFISSPLLIVPILSFSSLSLLCNLLHCITYSCYSLLYFLPLLPLLFPVF